MGGLFGIAECARDRRRRVRTLLSHGLRLPVGGHNAPKGLVKGPQPSEGSF